MVNIMLVPIYVSLTIETKSLWNDEITPQENEENINS